MDFVVSPFSGHFWPKVASEAFLFAFISRVEEILTSWKISRVWMNFKSISRCGLHQSAQMMVTPPHTSRGTKTQKLPGDSTWHQKDEKHVNNWRDIPRKRAISWHTKKVHRRLPNVFFKLYLTPWIFWTNFLRVGKWPTLPVISVTLPLPLLLSSLVEWIPQCS